MYASAFPTAQRFVRSVLSPSRMGVLEQAIRIAGTAPSGAHKQPWSFCVVTRRRVEDTDPGAKLKRRRDGATEARCQTEWLEDLAPLGTDAIKPYIEEAPALIVVFRRVHEPDNESGARHPNYYVSGKLRNCRGIAVGSVARSGHWRR